MRRVAIIQARMGSSRLPGKVLMPLAGKPVLWHIVYRLRKCCCLDEIVIATSVALADDAIADFGAGQGVPVIRGPEDNVLERYLLTARQLQADVIVRVTGDAPLVDPSSIDYLLECMLEKEADYCVGESSAPLIHEGFDPFTWRALEKLAREAGGDPVAREHVTAYFKLHPDFVRVARVPFGPEHQFTGARLSVDTPADLRFLAEVYNRLAVPAGDADILKVVKLLRREPGLLAINSHVNQKQVGKESLRVLFRCDGSREIGLGHVSRCLALADELRETFGCGVRFAMVSGPAGSDMVRRAGYPVLEWQGGSQSTWLTDVVYGYKPHALIIDERFWTTRSAVEEWRQGGVVTVVIDDSGEKRLAADLVFYPPVPQLKDLKWTGFTGRLYTGWDWLILRREFTEDRHHVPGEYPRVLVTMGGSDPAGMTLKALAALDRLELDFQTDVVLGPGFGHDKPLEAFVAAARRRYVLHRDVRNMGVLMAQADLAVASYGVTAFELAAMGVPAIHLCLTEDHVLSASALADTGAVVSMGHHTIVTPESLAERVFSLLTDKDGLERMSQKGRALIDGCGAVRIAQCVVNEMENNLARIHLDSPVVSSW